MGAYAGDTYTAGFTFKEPAVTSAGTTAYPSCTTGIVHHPGYDLNINAPTSSGSHTWDDFGLPVYAVADGLVYWVRPKNSDINPATKKPYGDHTDNPSANNYTVGQWLSAIYKAGKLASAPPPAALAITDSFVEYTGSWVGVIIQHLYLGKIYYSAYGHVVQINRNVVVPGKFITQATQIAQIGCVLANNSHLHFEIRKDNPHATDPTYFCQNTSDAVVDNGYLDPLIFVDTHTPYDNILTREIAQSIADFKDSRFGQSIGALQLLGQNPFNYPTLEIRLIQYVFSSNRIVNVYHMLDQRNEQGRFATFWDPDASAFKTIPTHKLD